MNRSIIRIFILAFLLLPFAFLLYSCSNDSTTTGPNNNTGNDSLIFSKDSLSIYSDIAVSSLAFYNDSVCTIKKFKVQFTSTTNDSTNNLNSYSMLAVDAYKLNDTTVLPFSFEARGNNINMVFNQTFSLTYNPPANIFIDFSILFQNFPSNLHKWIKLTGIKVYRTS